MNSMDYCSQIDMSLLRMDNIYVLLYFVGCLKIFKVAKAGSKL